MATLMLDPWVLSFRNGEDAELYVQSLLDLYDASSENAIGLQISAHAAEFLERDGAYPLSDELPRALWPMRADVYRIVSGLLDRLPKIEDQQIFSALAEGVTVIGSELKAYSPSHKEYLFDLITLSLVRSGYYKRPAQIFSRVTSESLELSCEADVLVIDSYGCDPAPVCGLYEANVTVNAFVRDFYRSLLPADLAMLGFVEKAIALAIWLDLRSFDTFAFKANGWSVGAGFLPSLISCGLMTNYGRMASLIRTAVAVIMSTNLRITHALREGTGGGCAQISRGRDGAVAWRADIDDELHLHYWKAGSEIQLANVVFHNNFNIEE